MSANFFAEFAPPPQHPLPPDFEYVDDKLYPPPPRQTTARGLLGAAAAGPNAAIAGIAGLPVDIANTALRGVGLQTNPAPIMGSAWLREIERQVGINPDLAPDATTAEKIAHATGYGAAAATLPATAVGLLGKAGTLAGPALETTQAITGAPTATTAAIGAAAGGAGGAAAEAAPEGFKTAAQLAAQLATGHAAGKLSTAVGQPTDIQGTDVERFLNEADIASARAAGAKTRAEIDQFIKNKEAGGPPVQIAPPQAAANAPPQPPEVQEAVQPPNAEAQTGTRQTPAKIAAPEDIEPARNVVDTAPTPPQAEAGNYQKGHVNYDGLPVTIENPKGSIRSGVDPTGAPWSSVLPADYGYLKGSVGKDGDQVDIFLGDKGPNGKAFVIDQNDPATGKFDEHKIVAGVDNVTEATRIYDAAFPDGSAPQRIGGITEVPIDQLKTWLASGQAKKPFAKPSGTLPEGFEPIAPGNAPNSAPSAQLAEKPAISTPEIVRGIAPPLGLRPIDIDPPAAAAAKQHQASGMAPDEAYEHAVIEAALADPKVQGIQDGEQLPAAPEPIQNLAQAPPEPRPPVARTGPVALPALGKSPAPGAPEAAPSVGAYQATPQALKDREARENAEKVRNQGGFLSHTPVSLNEREATKPPQSAQVKKPWMADSAALAAATQNALETGRLVLASGQSEPVHTPADKIAMHLLASVPLSRENAAKVTGHDLKDPNQLKAFEENVELGVVKAARQIVNIHGADPADTFDRLVKLYADQPKLGTRTSSSMRDQAYSTPIPLAYAASRLAGVAPDKTVYEPSAGNGALLIEAHAVDTVANELNRGRINALKSQGFFAMTGDASKPATAEAAVKQNDGPFDIVLANPPFGVRHGEGGAGDRFDLSRFQPGYETGEIDHAIALNSLAAMKPDGRAVLILGGPSPLAKSDEARTKAYGSKTKREFFKTLYDKFNVDGHFTVAGDLYEKQGAGWPVDVITISGAGKSALPYPMMTAPPILKTWGEVKEKAVAQQPSHPQPVSGASADVNAPSPAVGTPGHDQADKPIDVGRGNAGTEHRPEVEPGALRPTNVPQQHEHREPPAAPEPAERPVRGGPGGHGAPRAAERRPPGVSTPEPSFADRVKDVAYKLETPPFPTRVAISQVYDAYGRKYPDAGTLASFKERLVQAGKAREINLGRLDMPEGLPSDVRNRSAAPWGDDEVHFVLKPEPRQPRAAPAAPAQPEAPKEAETENQVAYSPKSTSGMKLGTLAPRNMRDASDAALARVESRHGPIAKYVASELGYKAADLGKHYSAEQVDALGLAIDNIERGASLILGDQTGIGKGRVLAGLLRYGIRNGMTPIFVTEKPNLYAAMFDDMTDIGMTDMLGREPRILPTNSNLKLPVGDQGTILKTPDGPEQEKQLRDIAATGNQQGSNRVGARLLDHDMIMTTYSQMQTVKGQNTARRDFLRSMAPNSIILFDESHNAGGAAVEKRIAKGKLPPPADRAEFARELVQKAKAVAYSSATYAKRPDSMRLYSKTDMRYAVSDMKDLGEAIKKGGVPMQQVVASALAESGQYLRRERSFDGIKYDMEVTPIDRELYAGFSRALRAINEFSKKAGKSVKDIDKQVKAEAAIAGQDASVGTAGAESTNFTSLMHNVVAQFLLASKAERAGQLAVEAINRGERPVIAVANTLESFVSDYMKQTGAKTGDLIRANFGDLLSRYLDRSRVVTIKKPFGAVEDKHTMTDEELGPEGLAAYHQAQAIINGLDFGKLPISPIDKIRQVISQAGHSVSEITGRNNTLDYGKGNIPRIGVRSPKEKSVAGRTQTVKDFNSGKLKALILNESGATGISLHDSEAFPESGRGQRAMIIAQAHPNITVHMQMLGRVLRTGQVSKPRYAHLGADVPAEKRPMAVLAKKLSSLNANTTADAKSGLSGKGAVDFLNHYGDEVVTQVMLDDMRAHIDLGEPLESLDPKDPDEDAARKTTGRIALLDPQDQERIYDAIESQYKAKIDDLDERGENALEAKHLDLQAKYEGGADISPKTGDSPFQAAVHVGTYDVKSARKPPKFDDVMKSAYAMLGREIVPKFAPLEALQTAGGKANTAMMTRADQAFNEYKSAMTAITKDPEVAAEQANRLADGREAMRDKLAVVFPGAILHTNNHETPLPDALVVGVKHEGKTINPYAASSWSAVLAMPGYGTRTVPFSQLTTGETGEANAMHVNPSKTSATEIAKLFDSFKSELREKRVIATGNLLAAYDLLHKVGQIAHFTMDDGTVRQGLMAPRAQTSHKEVVAGAVKKLREPREIIKYLEKPGGTAESADGAITITGHPSGGFLISIAGARQIGGKYFLDPGVLEALDRDEFIKRGSVMRALAPPDRATAVFEALIKAGANFQQAR